MNHNKKIALVTGASRGIGKAIALKLMKLGIIVVGTSTNKIGAETISIFLKEKGKGLILNVTESISIKNTLTKIRETFGEIDILINNAGITHDNLLIRMKEYEWYDVINTNLSSVFHLSKSVLRSMLKKRYGRIISISSVVGIIGNIGQTNYAAAKAGLIGFTKSLSQEVSSRGITVNVVAPGFIETDMTKTLSDLQKSNILSKIPINRLGYTNEIANAVAFLVSDEAAYITGETLHVNGGMYMA
ncbi:3-oxoacyl-ACP reductase FabG [Candidatus Providencia siddallii]|uniref:3-oxoacyl-[acyl-carrier-protein] reductase n=1 Tax=Candidatus Providencia siddallii TaxID=1715285 RepID=A0ABP1CDW1_9GAMM